MNLPAIGMTSPFMFRCPSYDERAAAISQMSTVGKSSGRCTLIQSLQQLLLLVGPKDRKRMGNCRFGDSKHGEKSEWELTESRRDSSLSTVSVVLLNCPTVLVVLRQLGYFYWCSRHISARTVPLLFVSFPHGIAAVNWINPRQFHGDRGCSCCATGRTSIDRPAALKLRCAGDHGCAHGAPATASAVRSAPCPLPPSQHPTPGLYASATWYR